VKAEDFARLAREFCTWAEGEPGAVEDEVISAIRLLGPLLAAGSALAHALLEEGPDYPVASEKKELIDRFNSMPFQYYRSIWSPADWDNIEPSAGDLTDDLTSIYSARRPRRLAISSNGTHSCTEPRAIQKKCLSGRLARGCGKTISFGKAAVTFSQIGRYGEGGPV